MAVMLQEWKCEVIRDVWLDLLRICMDTCSSKRKFIVSCEGYAVGPKMSETSCENASILHCFLNLVQKCLNRTMNFRMYYFCFNVLLFKHHSNLISWALSKHCFIGFANFTNVLFRPSVLEHVSNWPSNVISADEA